MKALICPSAVNSSNLGLTRLGRDENAHCGGMAGWYEIVRDDGIGKVYFGP